MQQYRESSNIELVKVEASSAGEEKIPGVEGICTFSDGEQDASIIGMEDGRKSVKREEGDSRAATRDSTASAVYLQEEEGLQEAQEESDGMEDIDMNPVQPLSKNQKRKRRRKMQKEKEECPKTHEFELKEDGKSLYLFGDGRDIKHFVVLASRT